MSNPLFKHITNTSWIKFFNELDTDIIEIVEKEYNKIKNIPNIFPTFENIFNFTNFCRFEDIKVLIISQDPYHQVYYNSIDKSYYPQATGLAFSVPKGCPIPPSLVNIYDNLLRYEHQIYKPSHGNLEYWAYQGVLLLNTSLTVEKSKPNSHQYIWSVFTDELIQQITQKHSGLVIVLWGGSAFNKMNIIKNKEKHDFIISSHPSPLGYKNKMKQYNSFYDTNHFGKINEILKTKKLKEIDWQIY
jgi:uracil-DNA glycosylase